MEQLVKEESQKLLAKQMQEARIQRQVQVRQQALAWSDAKRKKFEKAKEAAIKKLATQVTEQAQNTAIQNIQRLNQLNDLAMAEIGMAHRAAAGYQNVERLKSLKRLKNDEVAKNRGASAMMKLSKDRDELVAKSSAILNRKKEVREMEDRKAQEIINTRKPLSLTNIDTKSSKPVIGPPEYQQTLAKTLSTADSSSEPERIPPKRPSILKTQSRASISSAKSKSRVTISSSQDIINKERDKQKAKHDAGMLDRMVRIKTSDGRPTGDHPELSLIPSFSMRENNMRAVDGGESSNPLARGAVRYFDSALPKGEVKYIQPKGLAVKESRSDSPDAWAKGRQLSEQLLKAKESKEQKRLELEQRQRERSEQAILEEKLSREKMELENRIKDIMDPENMPLDIKSQSGIFEIVMGEGNDDEEKLEEHLSEDFLSADTDEEFAFPGIDAADRQQSQKTMKTYAVRGSIDPEGNRRRDSQPVKFIPSSSSSSYTSSNSSSDSFEEGIKYRNAKAEAAKVSSSKIGRKSERKSKKSLADKKKSKAAQGEYSERMKEARSKSIQTSLSIPSSHQISPPAEGPYHSTPDGKLKYHERHSEQDQDETQRKRPISSQEKAELLKTMVEGVISKRPQSIENMQVESSSDVSRIEIGSDMVEETPRSTPGRSDEYSVKSRDSKGRSSGSGEYSLKSRDSKGRSSGSGEYSIKSRDSRGQSSGSGEISFASEVSEKKGSLGQDSRKKLEGKRKSSQKRPSRESQGSIVTGEHAKDKAYEKRKESQDNQGSLEDFLEVKSDEDFVFPETAARKSSDKQPMPRDKGSAPATKTESKKIRGLMGMKSEQSVLEYALSSADSTSAVKSVDKVQSRSQSRHSQSKVLGSEGSIKSIPETTKEGRRKSSEKSPEDLSYEEDDVEKRLSSNEKVTPIPPSYDHSSPPAEGPFHSTPDGKLQHHRRSSESQEESRVRPVSSAEKAKILRSIMTDLLNKRREEIDAIPVEPSENMSRVKVDSDMFSETGGSGSSRESRQYPSASSPPGSGSHSQSSGGDSRRGSKTQKLSSKEKMGERDHEPKEKGAISAEAKAKILRTAMQDFLSKKPEEIDKIPLDVSSNVSRLVVDSDILGETSSSTPGLSVQTPSGPSASTSTATSCHSQQTPSTSGHSDQTPSTSSRSHQTPTATSTPDDSQASSGGQRRKCKKAKKTLSKEEISESKERRSVPKERTSEQKAGPREPKERRSTSTPKEGTTEPKAGPSEPREKRVLSAEAKTEFLKSIMQGLISEKPEDIDKLPFDVSSNVSRLVVDSDFFGDTSRTPARPDPNETSIPGSGSNRGSGGSDTGPTPSDGGASAARRKSNLDENKRRIISHYLHKMLERQPDSLEKLEVTVSSSSIIQVDSEIASETASSSSVHNQEDQDE